MQCHPADPTHGRAYSHEELGVLSEQVVSDHHIEVAFCPPTHMLFGSQNSRPCTGRLRPPARRAQHNPTSHSRVTRESSVWALLLKTGCSSSGVSELLTLPRQKELHGSEECFSVQKQFFHSNEAKKLTKVTCKINKNANQSLQITVFQ